MMRSLLTGIAMLLLVPFAHAADGMATMKSAHDVKTTLDRLEANLKDKGMIIVARVDHAAGAKRVDMELRPTELLIFGNPRGGTPLMRCGQTAAIDLPLKALAWQDQSGQVWLGYNEPAYLAKRHQLGADCAGPIEAMTNALRGFASAAVAP